MTGLLLLSLCEESQGPSVSVLLTNSESFQPEIILKENLDCKTQDKLKVQRQWEERPYDIQGLELQNTAYLQINADL